ncbi:MAG TPA: PadR family transcriptional regulator [Candidatus Bathyarchaeia archaeon]|nr:PadR family transcriptional regulator [Candidatus Bathyarchaeia archaeon]
MAQPQKELLGASTSLLILSVLAKEASYGYKIIKRMNDEAGGRFIWQEGTVYPLLHKLEKDGLVRAQWQHAETGRKRKYYYITARGRVVLSKQKETWATFSAVMTRVMGESNA